MSDVKTRQSEYRLAAVGIVALFTAALVLWQWHVTVQELDALSIGAESNYGFVLPQGLENQ